MLDQSVKSLVRDIRIQFFSVSISQISTNTVAFSICIGTVDSQDRAVHHHIPGLTCLPWQPGDQTIFCAKNLRLVAFKVGWHLGYVPNHLAHGTYRVKIPFDSEIITFSIAKQIIRGDYEQHEAALALDMVDDEDRVLELGGGLGFVSALLATKKKLASYTLVEADSRLLPLIRRTHELCGASSPITVLNGAATADTEQIAEGTVVFHVCRQFYCSSTHAAHTAIAIIDVPVVPLHDLIEAQSPNCLIVDIEGGEANLFDGSPLAGVRKILLEVHPGIIGKDGVEAVIANLKTSGFNPAPQWSHGSVVGFQR